jgi:hypothetical protein
MQFTQVLEMLDTLCPYAPEGFSRLTLPDAIWGALDKDPAYLELSAWMGKHGLSPQDLTVVNGAGGIKLAPPGVWYHGDVPVILFGFRDNKPQTVPLDGLILSQTRGNLYQVTLGSKTLPISVRLHVVEDVTNLPPLIIDPEVVSDTLKLLPTGGGSEDWKKFRDVIGEGESLELVVTNYEAKKEKKKDGTTFKVYLIYTDQGVFSVNERQFEKVDHFRDYWDLMVFEGDLRIRVTQDGYYSSHKVYKLTVAK